MQSHFVAITAQEGVEPESPFWVSVTHPQGCVGCGRWASDVLCRAFFKVLPKVRVLYCARCWLPTALETFVCERCKNVDFGFESARAPLRYEGAEKKVVHALKYGDYTRAVEKVAAPLMLGVLDGRRSHLRSKPSASRDSGAPSSGCV